MALKLPRVAERGRRRPSVELAQSLLPTRRRLSLPRIVAALRRVRGRVRAARHADAPQAFPAGAFYSPLVNRSVVGGEPDRSRIWPAEVSDPPGIDLRPAAQLALLELLGRHRLPVDWPPDQPGYDPANDQFPPLDAAVLYAMVRHLRPRRIVEVGSGWSTTVTARAIDDGDLDTDLTCIEPHPRDFLSAIRSVTRLRQEKVEHTPSEVFAALEAGDVLFIDSSHVAKTGSDVVHLLLSVVPRLADGVIVHVHDVFLPEDYPEGWVRAGFNWNEQYLVQAFLIGNARAHLLAMSRWLSLRHPDAVRQAFGPVELNGSSVWFATGPEPLQPR